MVQAEVGFAASFAYLINGGEQTVAVLDTSTRGIVATIPILQPSRLIIDPNGLALYVVTQPLDEASDNVFVIDTRTNTVTRSFRLRPPGTSILEVHPNGRQWVGVRSACPGDLVLVSMETGEVEASVPVGCFPDGIAVTPDGARAYVTNSFDSNPKHPCQFDVTECELDVSVIDLLSMQPLETISNVGAILPDVVAGPSNARVYVAVWAKIVPPGGTFAFSPGIALIDGSTVVRYIILPSSALSVAISPAGGEAYVFSGSQIIVVDLNAAEVDGIIRLFSNATYMAMTPDGKELYVTLDDADSGTRDDVAVVDIGARKVVDRITVGHNPGPIVIGPSVPITPPATGTPSPCAGDCDGSGGVSIDELIRGVKIALGDAPLSTCTACDSDGDGALTIEELVRAVGNALRGCVATVAVE